MLTSFFVEGNQVVGADIDRKALEILKRAEALANSAAVQLHLAQAYNGLNRKSDAIGALENASKLNPDPQTKASMDELAKALK
jgi:predicted Zn-dependent protease